MVINRYMTLCCLAVAFPLSAGTEDEVPLRPAAAAVEFRDQRGGSDSVAKHRGEVTVAMVVTAARLRNLKAWQRDLQERFDNLRFVLIADVPPDPPVSFERVASRLLEKVPSDVPVLIDLDRLWALELGLDTARPNVLLFDRDGVLAGRFRGLAKEEIVDEAARELEALVNE